ncbi:MAG: hypothetical protein JXQ81_00660 [Desulfuromonadales bacterium]|nr:hypothetical protein [Desulfuromonadales bacterium]MBN2790995.1 hypothetical protein [Desulfuromonadales bacterium]
MQKILEEIKTSPGVLGACLYSAPKGIIASSLPAIFKKETQELVGHTLNRIFRLNDTIKLDVNGLEIQYDEALIMVKRICKSSSLVLICEPDANIHLVNMTISILAEDLQNQITDCEKMPLHKEVPQENPQEVMKGEFSGELSTIKRALAQQIGPVAGKVMEKHLKTWLQDGQAEQQRLKELVKLLSGEIDGEQNKHNFYSQLSGCL